MGRQELLSLVSRSSTPRVRLRRYRRESGPDLPLIEFQLTVFRAGALPHSHRRFLVPNGAVRVYPCYGGFFAIPQRAIGSLGDGANEQAVTLVGTAPPGCSLSPRRSSLPDSSRTARTAVVSGKTP